MFSFSASSASRNEPDALYDSYIGRIADGDRDALGALYESAKSAVYGFALSVTRNRADAEDVLQDTFVSIHASARSYRKMGKPMAWILTITKNLALMKIRERRKTTDISEEQWDLFAENGRLEASVDRVVLRAALEGISREEGQIVMLHAVAGFKHREIADFLGMPLSTVLSKYNRAMKKLRVVLEEGESHAQ